jgi:hypothetical protein
MSYKNNLKLIIILIISINLSSHILISQTSIPADNTSIPIVSNQKKNPWFENFSIRGYVQARYNRLFETNPDLNCEQCDRSWGNNGGFFLRRIRIIFFGQIGEQVYFYIQPDFASNASTDRLHFAQIRDAYFDVGVDPNNEFRFRIGQSKVPYGFENMQSSQNRLALDRNDALNSAVSNERDLGVFFYWAPKEIRKLFSKLVSSGLKGSGDYGVFALGAYNGQTANNPELNNSPHYVSRLSYPFQFDEQIIEAGIQGYTGDFVLTRSNISTGTKFDSNLNYLDERAAASLIVYPQPLGFQAEYTIGKGPEFNTVTDSIEVRNLRGGYAQVMYKYNYDKENSESYALPFVKYQEYDGGKKHERDARSYRVRELEIGVEWSPVKEFELVTMYTISNRRFEDFGKQDNQQIGNLLRVQAQINF